MFKKNNLGRYKMAKVCNEALKIYKEIFDEAYLLGRSSGSDGVFICPDIAFEHFLQEKLAQLTGVEQSRFDSEVNHEVQPTEEVMVGLH